VAKVGFIPFYENLMNHSYYEHFNLW